MNCFTEYKFLTQESGPYPICAKRSMMNEYINGSENSTSYSSDRTLEKNMIQEEQFSNKKLTEMDLNRVIEMAWEDRTPFDAIKIQFGLCENEVKQVMKSNLQFKSYVLWRKRVESCQTKHLKKRNEDIHRFKCNRQRNISMNKISKRKKI